MYQEQQENHIVGLDMGTSKSVAVIGVPDKEARSISVIGIGSAPSIGLKRGVVIDIEATVNSLRKAIEQAELMAGIKIHKVYAGIAGSHIQGLNSNGIVAIKDVEVSTNDLLRVIDAAKAVAIPADRQILHILPKNYVIDGQEGIKQPLGMSGTRLESKVYLVTCARNALQNIEKCIGQVNLDVEGVILEQLASSYSVLTEDEKELGVCLVDIGGGTTDIAIFVDGALFHTSVIPLAGDQVTNDIAMALRTPTKYAEEIKVKYACAHPQLASIDQIIKVPGVGDRPTKDLQRKVLAEFVEPRYSEIFTMVSEEIQRAGAEPLIRAGVVLTGGTSKMEGALELAEEIFHMPVRLGKPKNISGLSDVIDNPVYSTATGLLLYGLKQKEIESHESAKQHLQEQHKKHWSTDLGTKLSQRFSHWFGK